MTSSQLTRQLWGLCQYLRDAGVSAHDYLEQLVYLLFLKMAHERQLAALSPIWSQLLAADEEELCALYASLLSELGKRKGVVGTIFQQAEQRVHHAAKLAHLIREIDRLQWSGLQLDILASAYEDILQKVASDMKSGIGQYFTPRPLMQAIVEVMRPRPGQCIADPACGTAGFLLAAHDYLAAHRAPDMTGVHARFFGTEIVPWTARMGVMNLLLHGICDADEQESPIVVADSLRTPEAHTFDMVLSNPPFGQEQGGRVVGGIHRPEFWAVTSNKQLNFLQHSVAQLMPGGQAALVLPDNVLFERGAGERIRCQLLQSCDVHTLLRLPTGIFYAPGVNANVLFLEKKSFRSEPWTSLLWIYDLRTNQHFTRSTRQLTRADLDDFVVCYCPENRQERKSSDRFRPFSYEELIKRDKLNLDIFWLQEHHSDEVLLSPNEYLVGMILDLRRTVHDLEAWAKELGVEIPD